MRFFRSLVHLRLGPSWKLGLSPCTALLLLIFGSVRHFVFPGPSLALGINAKTPEVQGNNRSHFPFCLSVDSMGPNLIFVLLLTDESIIWVAIQAEFSLGKHGSLSRPFLILDRPKCCETSAKRFRAAQTSSEF